MKKLMVLLVMLMLAGCGSGGGGNNTSNVTPPSAAEIAAAKLAKASLVTGTWLLAYNIGTTSFTDTLNFGTVSTTNVAPFDFTANITSNSGKLWLGGYTSTNETWTAVYTAFLGGSLIGSQGYEFQTDGNNLLTGACYYQTSANGTKSPCFPLTGVKTSAQ